MIRSVPNSWTRPTRVLKGWPASATSSPIRNTRGSRRISSASASLTASPYVSSRSLISALLGSVVRPSRVDVLRHLVRARIGRGQGELHAGIDLRLDVGLDALEDLAVRELLGGQPPGERLQWIVLGHPLLLLVLRAVDLAIDVADVVTVVAVRLAFEESGALAAPRALDETAHGLVDQHHVLAVDGLGVDAERARPGQDLAGGGLRARRVLAVEIVLADVDHGQGPERGHVHRLVQ